MEDSRVKLCSNAQVTTAIFFRPRLPAILRSTADLIRSFASSTPNSRTFEILTPILTTTTTMTWKKVGWN